MANGCTVPDNKWKVQTGESDTYQITIDVEEQTISVERLTPALKNVGNLMENVLSDTSMVPSVYMEAFPNPVLDDVIVRIQGTAGNIEVSIWDLKGNRLMVILQKDRLSTDEIRIPLSQLPEGIYLLKIETEAGVFTKKIIK